MLDWTALYNELNSVEVTTVNSVFKMCLSMILGSIIGLGRKRKGQSAGIRTFALISMGATLAMILSIYVPQEYLGLKNGDPGRIAAQVISGIGFLGAGAIIQMKGLVRGLTTAAGIWMVAIIGMALGVGMYMLSIFSCMLIYFVLQQLEQFEHRIKVGSQSRIINLVVDTIVTDIEDYRAVFHAHHVSVTNFYVAYDYQHKSTTINFVILARESTDYISLFAGLSCLNPTASVSIANQIAT